MTNLLPGIDWSDHRSFLTCGYPAAMMTDTAPARYPYYHYEDEAVPAPGTSARTVHYQMLARITRRMTEFLLILAKQSEEPEIDLPVSPKCLARGGTNEG